MPDSIEIAIYQLGIRLTQCRELHCRAISGYPYGPDEIRIGPDDVALLRQSIRDMGNAWSHFALVAGLHKGQRDAGEALIRDCRRLWKVWSKTPIRQLQNASYEGRVDDQEFYDDLQALTDQVLSVAETKDVGGGHHVDWAELGTKICDGAWVESERQSPGGKVEPKNRGCEVRPPELGATRIPRVLALCGIRSCVGC